MFKGVDNSCNDSCEKNRCKKYDLCFKPNMAYVIVNEDEKVIILNKVPYFSVDSVIKYKEIFYKIYFKRTVRIAATCVGCSKILTVNHGKCSCGHIEVDPATIQILSPKIILYNGNIMKESEIDSSCEYIHYNFGGESNLKDFIEVLKKYDPNELVLKKPVIFIK